MANRRRQWRAEKQDIRIAGRTGDDTYRVTGTRGVTYTVDLKVPRCDCPDWKKRQPEGGCKHILKIKLDKGLIEPLPSAYTNFGSPERRSSGEYSKYWESLSRRTKERDGWKCQKCGIMGGPYGSAVLNAHHMRPKSDGGKDRLDNLITVCKECHEAEHGHSIPSGTGGQSRGQSPSADDGQNSQTTPEQRDISTQTGTTLGTLAEKAREKASEKSVDPHTGLRPGDQPTPSESWSSNTPHVDGATPDPLTEAEKRVLEEMAEAKMTATSHNQETPNSTDAGSDDYTHEEANDEMDPDLDPVPAFTIREGIFISVLIGVMLVVVFPPFLEVKQWKVGTGMAIASLTFFLNLARAQWGEIHSHVARDVIGILIFGYGGIALL